MRKKVLLTIICFFIIFSNFALSSVKAVYNASEVQNTVQVHTNNMNQLDEEIRASTTVKENTQEINNIKELESSKYIIDDENKIIYRVVPETRCV